MKSREISETDQFSDWAVCILNGDPDFVLKTNLKP